MTILSAYALIVAAALLANGEARDCDIDYAAAKAEQLATIEAGLNVYRREQDETKWSPEEKEKFDRAMALRERRDLIVDQADLDIVDTALSLFADEASWDREDDRQCDNNGDTLSLFCALAKASVQTIGEYQHRRTALQEVRFAVEEASAGKDYAHRMMDFNNDPATSFADARGVLLTARERIAARLDKQARCEIEIEGVEAHG